MANSETDRCLWQPRLIASIANCWPLTCYIFMFISIFCHCNCSVCGTPFRKQQQQKKGRFVLHWWAVWQTVSSWWSPIAQKLSSIFRRIWRCASHTENGHVDETKKTKWTLKNETKRRSVEPIGPNDQRRSTPYYTRHTLHTLQASLHVIRIDYAHNSVLGARRVNDNGQQQWRERERTKNYVALKSILHAYNCFNVS